MLPVFERGKFKVYQKLGDKCKGFKNMHQLERQVKERIFQIETTMLANTQYYMCGCVNYWTEL